MQYKEINACEVNIIPSSGEGKVAREVGDITNDRGERRRHIVHSKAQALSAQLDPVNAVNDESYAHLPSTKCFLDQRRNAISQAHL